jgi:Flp pilus assembly protein TadG
MITWAKLRGSQIGRKNFETIVTFGYSPIKESIRPAMTRISALRRLLRDIRGTTLVLIALTMSALIGFTGLGVETGLWYAIKVQNQSAADLAASSGAYELAASQPYLDICEMAKRDATRNGFTFNSFTCPTSTPGCSNPSAGQMCVNAPPTNGTFANQVNAVEVILAQQQNALFASLFIPNVTILTRAVAYYTTVAETCMLALGTTGTDLDMRGNSSIVMPGCAFADNSIDKDSISIKGNVSITAQAISTVGNYSTSGASFNISGPIFVNSAPVVDPYANVSVGALPPGSCSPDPNINGPVPPNLDPGLYCALTINAGANVHLNHGVYYLVGTAGKKGGPGDLTISGGTVNGSDVTIVLTAGTGVPAAGSINISGGTVTLSAPGPGAGLLPPSPSASQGLLIYQDPTKTVAGSSNSITGGANI